MRAFGTFVLPFVLLLTASATHAQVPPPARSSLSLASQASPCGLAPQADPALTTFFLNRILVPGSKFSLAGIPAETLQKLAAMQKQAAQWQAMDWPNLCRYQRENATLLAIGGSARVVFLGDSITEFWKTADPDLFAKDIVDRGISGQTTPQILLRFYQDVVALHPKVVHIMAGTNDVGGNTGPASDTMILENIRAMIDIAEANGIRVILASITPTKGMMTDSDERGMRTKALDVLLRELARERHLVYADYYPLLDDGTGAMGTDRSNDGIHPNRAAYALMRPIAERAIAAALAPR